TKSVNKFNKLNLKDRIFELNGRLKRTSQQINSKAGLDKVDKIDNKFGFKDEFRIKLDAEDWVGCIDLLNDKINETNNKFVLRALYEEKLILLSKLDDTQRIIAFLDNFIEWLCVNKEKYYEYKWRITKYNIELSKTRNKSIFDNLSILLKLSKKVSPIDYQKWIKVIESVFRVQDLKSYEMFNSSFSQCNPAFL
ncbi:unnamed protein product, partial [marine sediment metagenome]